MKIEWSYLNRKFDDQTILKIFNDMVPIIQKGAFTLGETLERFEKAFASKIGAKHGIGVASGTDAIKLSLLACGIKSGDEVITAANTFIATAGAIMEIGAIPVFVDVTDNFCMDADLIEAAITPKTKAIVPVHLTGQMADMVKINAIAEKHGIVVVEDACQCYMGSLNGKHSGTWGKAGAFSLHPLKNLSVWADGGIIVTDDDELAAWLRLYRNHGLRDRDNVEIAGCNSRLDPLQCVVALHLLDQVDWITDKRIANAKWFDEELGGYKEIKLSQRFWDTRKVTFQLYENFFERHDELLAYLINAGIEAKVHYPVPCYRHKPFQDRYKKGDFPVTDRHAETMISLPAHEHLTDEEKAYIVGSIKTFYGI